MSAPTDSSREQLRLRSIAWALGAGLSALAFGLPFGVEAALRAGGCGFFYGLLAFHLQRVDPNASALSPAPRAQAIERRRSCAREESVGALMLRDHARFRLFLLRHGCRRPSHWC